MSAFSVLLTLLVFVIVLFGLLSWILPKNEDDDLHSIFTEERQKWKQEKKKWSREKDAWQKAARQIKRQ